MVTCVIWHVDMYHIALTRKNCFRYLKLTSPLNVAICTTISYTLWVEWYYLKNNYLTLRSKVKVQWRSLQYATHHCMVMHPHTKYHWPISKDKKVMVRTSFAEKKRKKKIRLRQYVSLRLKRRHDYHKIAKNKYYKNVNLT